MLANKQIESQQELHKNMIVFRFDITTIQHFILLTLIMLNKQILSVRFLTFITVDKFSNIITFFLDYVELDNNIAFMFTTYGINNNTFC